MCANSCGYVCVFVCVLPFENGSEMLRAQLNEDPRVVSVPLLLLLCSAIPCVQCEYLKEVRLGFVIVSVEYYLCYYLSLLIYSFLSLCCNCLNPILVFKFSVISFCHEDCHLDTVFTS